MSYNIYIDDAMSANIERMPMNGSSSESSRGRCADDDTETREVECSTLQNPLD